MYKIVDTVFDGAELLSEKKIIYLMYGGDSCFKYQKKILRH